MAATNTAPSAARAWGSSPAQLTESISRRPSRTATAGEARNMTRATAVASTMPAPSETSVTCLGSTSGTPPISTPLRVSDPARVTTGGIRAGMNSRLPQRAARSTRSVCGAGSPLPIRLKPATRAMATSRTPLTVSGR